MKMNDMKMTDLFKKLGKQTNMNENVTNPNEMKNTENNQSANESKTNGKTKIYNLVILDKSGSMSWLADAAIAGFNDTLAGIREAQKKFAETQEHFVSLMIFDTQEKTLLYDKVPVAEVKDLTRKEYRPCGGTPLFDAMGFSLTALRQDIQKMEDATAEVTIITDGLENASREYNRAAIRALVDDLSNNEGWNFTYIGTNQDVESEAASMSIKTTLSFSCDMEGMHQAWLKEQNAKMRKFDEMNDAYCSMKNMSVMERKAERAKMNKMKEKDYYWDLQRVADRITPERIETLQANEVFVFGSNSHGHHAGGAARQAVESFGAVEGQAVGLQGQSYAIPTVGVRPDEIRHFVDEFVDFALQHPELKFYVTRVGCGIAGRDIREMARMFRYAQKATNISLPKEFWEEIL